MLDYYLAEMYNVETKQLKRQVKQNMERFPDDFMFELNKEEFDNLRSQFGTLRWGGRRYLPYAEARRGDAFEHTEQRNRHTGKHTNNTCV